MGDIIRKIDYYKIEVPDKAGEGAKVLGALREAGVNLLAFTGFPRGRRAQMDFFPEDTPAFRKAMKKAGHEIGGKKSAFLIQGDDRAGAIAEFAARLGAAGISIVALDGVAAGGGRYAAILWVDPKDVGKAAKVLGAR